MHVIEVEVLRIGKLMAKAEAERQTIGQGFVKNRVRRPSPTRPRQEPRRSRAQGGCPFPKISQITYDYVWRARVVSGD